MMWLEIYNYVTTKRKFITKIDKRRCFISNERNIHQYIENIHYYCTRNEKINFLLLSKSPYIAIKI